MAHIYDRQQTLERQIKDVFFRFTYDGTNFTKVGAGMTGVYGITKLGAGEYKLELEDKWCALRGFKAKIINATEADRTFQIKAYDVNPSTGRASISFYTNTAGSATELPNGDIIGKIVLKNTSVY